MMRVPGSDGDLLRAKARGADVRIVYSPTDALALAEQHPDREVVFFAVGFETTAPANAMSVWLAAKKNVTNFSILTSHVRVPPAIRVIMDDPAHTGKRLHRPRPRLFGDGLPRIRRTGA